MKHKDKSETSKSPKTPKETPVSSPKAPAESTMSASAGSPSTEFGGEDPYEGMDDVTKACFDVRL